MKKTVIVEFWVDVDVDESKFTPEFMDEFSKTFFEADNIDNHIEHIAWLECRQMLEGFVEGYGEIKEFGISASIADMSASIE